MKRSKFSQLIVVLVAINFILVGCNNSFTRIFEFSTPGPSTNPFDVSNEFYETAVNNGSYLKLPEIPLNPSTSSKEPIRDYIKTPSNSFLIPNILKGEASSGNDSFEKVLANQQALVTFDIAYFTTKYLDLYFAEMVNNAERNMFGNCSRTRRDSIFDNNKKFYFIDSDITCPDFESQFKNNAGWHLIASLFTKSGLSDLLNNPVRSIDIYFVMGEKLVSVRFLSTSQNIDENLDTFLQMYDGAYVNRDQKESEKDNLCGYSARYRIYLSDYFNDGVCIYEEFQKTVDELEITLPGNVNQIIVKQFAKNGFTYDAFTAYLLTKRMDVSSVLPSSDFLTDKWIKVNNVEYYLTYREIGDSIYVEIINHDSQLQNVMKRY